MHSKWVIDMKDGFSIELSKDEFYVLLGHFGPAAVLGMTHPFRGLLSDEIALATGKALQSLMGRNLIRIGDEGVQVDSALESAIQVCAHPEHSLIIQAQRIDEPERHFIIHFREATILEQTEYKPDLYRLTELEDRKALLSWLTDLLQLGLMDARTEESFNLDEMILFEVRALCAEGHKEKATGRLLEAGLFEEQCHPLVSTLSIPISNASFAFVANRDKLERQYVRGFAVLESEEYLWLLHPLDDQDKRRVKIIPATPELVQARFEMMLP
jgi:hypothetical protein